MKPATMRLANAIAMQLSRSVVTMAMAGVTREKALQVVTNAVNVGFDQIEEKFANG